VPEALDEAPGGPAAAEETTPESGNDDDLYALIDRGYV
jgi:hypothetical protein